MSLRIAGRNPSGEHLKRIQQSPNYRKNGFQNLSETPMLAEEASYWKMIKDYFGSHKDTAPAFPIPGIRTDLVKLQTSDPVLVWFGHSSYLIRLHGKNILVDPVFSGNAAPLSFMVKSFPGSDIYDATDMPHIDYLILTHDHYDHLDFKTIRKLRSKIGLVYCSLGMSAHLVYWGVDENKIIELDWWDSKALDQNLELTVAPARHFSGRGIKRGRTLWSSFILKSPTHNIYLGGDSGYDTHFREIGLKHGPFDLAILEAGQYNKLWPLIHMMPEETVQAAVDLQAKTLLPVHWGKFALAMHPWYEPIKRVMAKAKELNMEVNMPMIGEPLYIGSTRTEDNWWDRLI